MLILLQLKCGELCDLKKASWPCPQNLVADVLAWGMPGILST